MRLMLVFTALWPLVAVSQERAHALLLQVTGVIGPAMADYVTRNLHKAQTQGAALVIIEMDTPGGLDLSMREMIREILASPVPVVMYVAPSGARAASAGTYLLYASQVAAKAPGDNHGAATPLQIALAPRGDDGKKVESGGGDAMAHKMVNDAVAYIQSLARLRGRNAEWAEKAVREAASLPAEEALRLRVVDVVAKDMEDLLSQIDGRRLTLASGERVIQTADLAIDEVAPDWRSRLLAIITDPNVAYVLMLVGIYGLIYELASPGAVLPGVVGAICLLLALFAFQVLPINYAGLALIAVGVAFMVGEALLPSFGALGIAGLLPFIIPTHKQHNTDAPANRKTNTLIPPFTATSALFFIFVIGLA